MINRNEAGIGGVVLLAGLGWAHAGSIPNTSQLCTKLATSCPIAVRVQPATGAGGCTAVIDIDRARVNSTVPVAWYIAKTNMTDANEYEFVGDGIDWAVPASAALDFKHQPALSAPTKVQWQATVQAASRPFLDYKPRVHIRNNPVNCSAPDPKINNDGP